MYRNTYVEINLDNIAKNVSNLIKRYNNYQYYFGVIKANAYGHGDIKVAQEIVKQGINYLAVSSLDEALNIRRNMKYVSILCLEPIKLEYINEAIKNNITIVISSYEYYLELIKKQLKGDLKVHLQIDAGMNRLGVKEKLYIEEIVKTLYDHKKILLEGLYTDLADADNIDSSSFDDQINKLIMLTKDINLEEIPIIHIYSSASLINHPKLKIANGIRLGICMYGVNPVKHKQLDFKLRPALSLYSNVIEIKQLKEGESIGFNNNFIAKRDALIGIIPIGYADGFSKRNTGRNVSINGVKYKIIDEINMNMLTIYIDDGVNLYDKVALIGEVITIEEVAQYIEANEYEVMTSINDRVPKVYLKNGQLIK